MWKSPFASAVQVWPSTVMVPAIRAPVRVTILPADGVSDAIVATAAEAACGISTTAPVAVATLLKSDATKTWRNAVLLNAAAACSTVSATLPFWSSCTHWPFS